MLPSVRIEPRLFMNLWFQIQHYPFWAKWAFACKTETLPSLYSHALLEFFLFSDSKASDTNIGIIAHFVHRSPAPLNKYLKYLFYNFKIPN